MMAKSQRIGRRHVLQLFSGAVVSHLSRGMLGAQNVEPDFFALDHIEFYVSNVEKSRDFFVRVFGNTLRMRGMKRYLKLGSSYMAFEPPRGNNLPGSVDHFSVSIKKLEMAKLHTLLQQRGVTFQDYPSGRDTGISDGDGSRTQLSPEDGWSLLNPTNFVPESVEIREESIFQPRGIDHVLLNVSDVEKSVAFYEKFLGKPLLGENGKTWFQVGLCRVGLVHTPTGQRAGVNRFCVSAPSFDQAAANRKLQQLGATIERSETTETVDFRDLDGLLIQVKRS